MNHASSVHTLCTQLSALPAAQIWGSPVSGLTWASDSRVLGAEHVIKVAVMTARALGGLPVPWSVVRLEDSQRGHL